MRSFSRGAVAVALAAAVAAIAGCAPADARPDPTEVVQRYLDAIAEGDAATAAELDRTAVFGNDAGTPPPSKDDLTDEDTLRTDDVLAGAQRIENVVVDPDSAGGDPDERGVTFSFELAGQRYDGMLDVAWDEEREEWVLLDTIADKLLIQAQVSRIEAALIGFSVPGASVAAPADPRTAPIQWLVYPGVYTVTGDLDPTVLVDPALGAEREVVIADPAVQPSLIYEVTALT